MSSPRSGSSPALRDPWTIAVLLVALVLLAYAFAREEGYQLADSVEHMERALAFVRDEEMIDAGAIRPFGFSSLLVPFFVVSDWLGVPALRPVAWSIALLQMLLGLALVAMTMRLGARVGGRRAGLAAGFLVAVNPIFLQYAVQPVSGIAAALFLALGLDALLERGTFRTSFRGGLWLGAAFLMAYQSFLILLAVGLLLLVRDRWRHRATLAGVGAGIAVAIGLQIALDRLTYGTWGISVGNYLVQNFGAVLTRVTLDLGFRDLATRIYSAAAEIQAQGAELIDPTATARQMESKLFYAASLPQMLAWPAVLCGALGLARSVLRASWRTTLLVGLLAIDVGVMSFKGSKSLRLLLPVLPVIAVVCAWGWDWIAGAPGRRTALRALGAALILVAAAALGVRELGALNTRRFGGYWAAMDFVNREAVGRPRSVGSAYNWAVYMRQSPAVELVKLPWQVNLWTRYTDAQRAADLDALDELDVFIAHLPVLKNHPELMAWVDEHFAVRAAFYDQRTYEDLGPIFVLYRLGLDPRAERFWDVVRGETPEAYSERLALPAGTRFVAEDDPDAAAPIDLLGWEYETLPPQGLGWITYHWRAPAGVERDYSIVDRLTSPDERNAWDNNHVPAYGLAPTSTWEPGAILRESYLVVAAAEPFRAGGAYRPIGGGYRRGDLIPVRLWMKLVEYDPDSIASGSPVERERLLPVGSGGRAVQPPPESSEDRSAEGLVFSQDDLVVVGGFLMPVQPRSRLADDGRPIP